MHDYQSTIGRAVSLEKLENELVSVSLILAGTTRALEAVMGDVDLDESLFPDLNLIKAAVERAASRLESVIPDLAPLAGSAKS